jgi:hypothetical protein
MLSLVVFAVILFGSCGLQSASSVAASFGEILSGDHGLTAADGVLPGGASVFASDFAGVVNLNPDLLAALRDAAAQAADDGVSFYINSGWRSVAYQDELLRQAIAQYGSAAEAARWVATAQTSPHVSGEAADIGNDAADEWLNSHGAKFGLCQIYRNEPWHFELRPQAVNGRCPRMYADPTHDPRMQQ